MPQFFLTTVSALYTVQCRFCRKSINEIMRLRNIEAMTAMMQVDDENSLVCAECIRDHFRRNPYTITL